MPIYEYRCDNCDHEFETIQKLSDAPLTRCPACARDALRKKVSAAGFRLKGGGWYETDFKAGRKRNVAGDEAGANKKEDKGAGASPDAAASKSEGAGGKAAAGSSESESKSKSGASTASAPE